MTRAIFGKVAAVATLVASVAMTQPAGAQISKLNIVGTVDIYQLVPGGFENIVIDFLPPSGGGVGTVNALGPETGVFAIIPQLTPGTNVDFVFGPAALPATTPTPSVILTIGGFTFTANSFGPGNIPGYPFTLDQIGGTVFANLNVTGIVTGPGLAAGGQAFIGGYSTQFPGETIASLSAKIEAGTVVPSSISASFVTNIPEPATVALMGTGLVALFGVGLRRRQNA